MRADAERNRRRLLDAARQVFVEVGVEAPLQVIARRAGVGIATLYRHFPDRSDLVRAVAVDVMSRTLDEAHTARDEEPDAFASLRRYMHRALDAGAPAIMPLLDDETRGHADVRALLDQSAAAQSKLLRAASREGSLRAGVEFSDIGLVLARFSRPIGHNFDPALESSVVHRHLDVFIDGLHRGAGAALPDTDLTLGQLREMQRAERPPRSPRDP